MMGGTVAAVATVAVAAGPDVRGAAETARLTGSYLAEALAMPDTPKNRLAAVLEIVPPGVAPADYIKSLTDALDEATAPDDWESPQPLMAKYEPLAYPLEAVPEVIRGAVHEVAGFVKAPLSLVAGCALSAISVAIQPLVDVRRAERLQGPCSIFSLGIFDSGERKTTCDAFFTSAIRKFEQEQVEAMQPEITRYKAAISAWSAERDGILAAIKQASQKGAVPAKLKNDLADLQEQMPVEPRVPRLVLGDVTPEALAWHLAKNWPSAGVLSSEAGAVLGSHGMGADSAMRNMALLNVCWDGGVHTVGRRTSESFAVKGARLTMGLQIQEATLKAFLAKSGELARGTGLLARFLVSWSESTQGSRAFTEAPPHWPALSRFHARIEQILHRELPIGEDGSLSPLVIDFTPDAKSAWIRFHDEVEAELGKGGALYDVRDVASKTADNAARLACLFHAFTGEIGTPIPLDSFEAASRIVEWHLSESRRFFGEMALPVNLQNMAKLDAWLIEYCSAKGVEKVSFRDIQRLGPYAVRQKSPLEDAVHELQELSRISAETEGRQRIVRINPRLLGV